MLHTDGRPVAGYRVVREKHGSSFGWFGDPSSSAIDPNIQFCGSSADNTLACWHPMPLNLTLRDGTVCDARDGGAASRSQQHPSWVRYYYCTDNQKAVYGPTLDDGIDAAMVPWTVVVFPISGVGAGRNQSVRTAYFVGTAK